MKMNIFIPDFTIVWSFIQIGIQIQSLRIIPHIGFLLFYFILNIWIILKFMISIWKNVCLSVFKNVTKIQLSFAFKAKAIF